MSNDLHRTCGSHCARPLVLDAGGAREDRKPIKRIEECQSHPQGSGFSNPPREATDGCALHEQAPDEESTLDLTHDRGTQEPASPQLDRRVGKKWPPTLVRQAREDPCPAHRRHARRPPGQQPCHGPFGSVRDLESPGQNMAVHPCGDEAEADGTWKEQYAHAGRAQGSCHPEVRLSGGYGHPTGNEHPDFSNVTQHGALPTHREEI